MDKELRKMYDKINTVTLNRDDYNMILTDRLDFGFDSLYFRYAEVCDELAVYKAQVKHSNPVEERANMNARKMHFYQTLEQLVHAHDKGEEK